MPAPSSAEFLMRATRRYAAKNTPERQIELGQIVARWQRHEGGPDAAPPEVREAGIAARNALIVENMGLAVSLANRASRFLPHTAGLSHDDLVSAAIEGLKRAAELNDPSLGYRLSTISYWWIRQSLTRLVEMNRSHVHIPPGQFRNLKNGVVTANTQAAAAALSVLSLDVAPNEDGEDLGSFIPDMRSLHCIAEHIESNEKADRIHAAIDQLPEKDRELIHRAIERGHPGTSPQYRRAQEKLRQLIAA